MTTSFFNGESTFPENNTTDALIDALEVQLAAATAGSQAVEAAATAAAASASNAAISEANVAGLSQAANDSLALAQDAIDAANAASTLATTSATSASNSATAAAGASTTATGAAADALVSEENAAASEAAALASKNAAATSQADALTSKNAAASSASTATTQAGTATTQAGIATTQAGIATTQATVASGAASSASTSASTATTQATAAASSATSAANSAAVATGFTASLAGRNKIINGSFIINQRAYVSGTATTAANQYTLDRWRVVVSGQTLPFAASGNGRLVTAPAGGLEQVIESGHIEGGPFTLSWTGTAVATLNGTSITKGGTVTLPANTNATVRFSSGTVGFVQLEAGSVATPFEHRMLPVETFLCQRYALSLVGWWPAQCTSTTTATVMLPVSTPLRGLPTYIPNGTANVSGATSLFLPVTGTTVSLSGSGAPTLLVTVASGLVAGNATALIAPNAILSAEL